LALREVAGSNPVTPTFVRKIKGCRELDKQKFWLPLVTSPEKGNHN
jgi:hypothetical protein